ncbi:DinB family protein [Flavihumibacter stibioxidans]|uniref:Metal-dependent hydrolase n=1 Tax=Flavihumibacter stibioxidans TaxID=1834163 RepID=A0ABR7M535_9BACT|nr:DinB family protein [Flavihumibacter stibioxidans]MBC6489771.1 metal-dependent hydrolase [Flavihumibacter stibioxidans]
MQKHTKPSEPEWWQRGPVDGVIPELQPVAHALLQARDEINAVVSDFPESHLWIPLHEMASVAFHLQHIVGVIDRLFTYANGQTLSEEQMAYLKEEGVKKDGLTLPVLVKKLNERVDQAIRELKKFQPGTATTERFIGRKKIPTTEIGLLFHAAEHTMRHTGQLLVTVGSVRHFTLDL